MSNDFRPNDQIKKNFLNFSQILDQDLSKVRIALEQKHISVADESNRSGFDKSGFPYYSWNYVFEKRVADGEQIKKAIVRISYVEPLMKDEMRNTEITRIAEIFQVGKPSEFEDRREKKISFDELTAKGIDRIVLELLAEAEQILENRVSRS